MSTAEFATARCHLAPVDSIAAIETIELHGLFADPQVRHYLCDDQVLGTDRVRSIIEGSITHFRESGLGLWTVSAGVTAERAGIVGFAEFSAPGALELMYAFYPRFWGRGLATETARAVMERGFTAGLREIHASTDEPNEASIAVLGRLGFRKTDRQEADPPRTIWPQQYFVADVPGDSPEDPRGGNKKGERRGLNPRPPESQSGQHRQTSCKSGRPRRYDPESECPAGRPRTPGDP